jgi:hypothetical protein
MRSALLAADLVPIPAQPSPFDGWASGEILRLIGDAQISHPQMVAGFALNRSTARIVIARETVEALADYEPPALAARMGQSVAFAVAVRSGRLVSELEDNSLAVPEIATFPSKSGRPNNDRAPAEAWLCLPSRRANHGSDGDFTALDHGRHARPDQGRGLPAATSPSPTCCGLCSPASSPTVAELRRGRTRI